MVKPVMMHVAKKWKRNRFPRGSVHVVMDFSENGKFGVKLEHQTRYYQTHGYTLFGMVLDSWIDDHLDTSLSPELKTRLKKLMDDNGRPHIITTTHIVASEDTSHDPSSVMHYTSKVLILWCKKTLKGFAAGDGHSLAGVFSLSGINTSSSIGRCCELFIIVKHTNIS